MKRSTASLPSSHSIGRRRFAVRKVGLPSCAGPPTGESLFHLHSFHHLGRYVSRMKWWEDIQTLKTGQGRFESDLKKSKKENACVRKLLKNSVTQCKHEETKFGFLE
jgi:hypothetical protein